MENLISQLIKQKYLKTPDIIEAFERVDRKDFVPEDLKSEANVNAPLPIGFGQTISQPLTVAFMLELLQPKPGDKILDIGSGSGWQTALLAYIASKKQGGKVYGIERIPQLVEFSKRNIEKYQFIQKGIVEILNKDGSRGLKQEALFDKIIAAASAEEIPGAWKQQLKIKGRLVTPVKSSIWLLIKNGEAEFEKKEFPGFAFVPLIEG